MNKLLTSVLALLLLASGQQLAHAIAIPEAEDADNGPAIWLVPVYNNASATVSAGDVVIWDIDASTGDNDNWITTSTAGDTGGVAGVVYGSSIAAGNKGTIAVHGVVPVNMQGGGNSVKGPVCTGTVAGKARSCTTTTLEANRFGNVTQATTSGVAYVNVNNLN